MRRAAVLLLVLFVACSPKSRPPSYAAKPAAPPPDVPRLLQQAQSPDAKVRSAAWVALGKAKAREAVPLLLPHLADADEKVATDAAYTLGNIGDPRAIDPLFAILQRKHTKEGEDLQKAAGSALGSLGAVDRLLAAIDDKNDFVRTYAAIGLGEAKDARAIPALVRHLGDETGDSASLEYEIGQALNKIGPKGVDAVLAAAKSADERVRGGAVNALGNSSDPRAEPALLQLLHDESQSVRNSIGFYFTYRTLDAATHKSLADALQKKDWVVVQGAMPYYVQRGIAGSEPVLVEAMDRSEGDMTIAELFLNSGNPALKACAMKWAEKRGWKVNKETNENTIHQRWGSGK
jgi:HEAT repeat protein